MGSSRNLMGDEASQVKKWVETSFSTSDFVEVWTNPFSAKPHIFKRAVFQTNSNKVLLNIKIVDESGSETELLDVDLEEISQNFKLDRISGVDFSIREYREPNLWVYEPTNYILIGSGDKISISMKSKQGTKTVARGMSEWGIK